jgi:hypothetical protein
MVWNASVRSIHRQTIGRDGRPSFFRNRNTVRVITEARDGEKHQLSEKTAALSLLFLQTAEIERNPVPITTTTALPITAWHGVEQKHILCVQRDTGGINATLTRC